MVTAGAKGCVVFAADTVTSYRGFLGVDDRYSHAHWLYQHNGGVFLPPWGKIEQWLISVQHNEADIDRLIENFAVFARAARQEPGVKPMAHLQQHPDARVRHRCVNVTWQVLRTALERE